MWPITVINTRLFTGLWILEFASYTCTENLYSSKSGSQITHTQKIKLKTRCKQTKQNKYKIQFYLFDSISFQWPYLKRMIHSTRHQLLTKDVKVLKIRLKDNEDKWLTVSYHKPDQLQTAWLTVLRTSSLCPSTPPNIATSTSVLMFHNLRLWSANNITV